LKIKQIYDQGTDSRKEDLFVDFPGKIMGVLDTGSGVFIPPTKPQMFYGMTGGQYTGQLIKGSILAGIITKENPRYILKSANIDLALVFQDHNLNLETPENNPFASYALAFFNNNNIEIIQGGDCQFIWQSKDGSVGWTKKPNTGL
jgi:hypothetical protein